MGSNRHCGADDLVVCRLLSAGRRQDRLCHGSAEPPPAVNRFPAMVGQALSLRCFRHKLLAACALVLLAPLAMRAGLTTASTAPVYSVASIVNAATQMAQSFAPNTIATIYGTNLSWDTHSVSAVDLAGGRLPTSLDGVTVYVNGLSVNLFYVSPSQINFLIPYELNTLTANVQVVRQGVAGPTASLMMSNTAPGFFEWNGNLAVAEHADGNVITPSNPATPGEIIVLYAAGLGRTQPDIASGEPVGIATNILYLAQLQVLLNGVALPASSIYYAGLAPGFVGLYQINLRLPLDLPANPSIQLAIGSQQSPAGVELPAQ
jgi:uncharacterized protein (TIGR03437 family)